MNGREIIVGMGFAALAFVGCATAERKADCDPTAVGRLIMNQMLSSEPCDYKPIGYTGGTFGGGKWLPYAAASWWANGIDFAVKTGDRELKDQLVARFKPYLKGGKYQDTIIRKHHVDDTISGVVPCAIYIATGDESMKAMGLDYADTQWAPPCEASLKERHAMPKDVQERYWREGYTPQTRLWIDDMYMIIAIQTMAYRVTGDRKYLERTAKEMCLYLDKLQLGEGEAKGLFYHAPDVPYVWGRGDGWMAAGMALLLSYIEPSSPYHAKILRGYRDMMAALLKFQRPDGLWGQLVNEPSSWAETSGSAMFTYAFIVGSSRGWIDRATYLPAARKAWRALCGRLDRYGNISDVCVGTGKRNDHQYYLDRSRINGDPHGEAPMMW